MTAMIILDVGDLHRWTETEGEATAEYENSLLRCRPHLRDIRRYTITPVLELGTRQKQLSKPS